MKSKDFDLDFARRERYTYTKIFPRRAENLQIVWML